MNIKKGELIFSEYDPGTGISTVRIKTDRGIFEGKASVHPDEESPSRLVGCQYAEMRAYVKYFRYLIKLNKFAISKMRKMIERFPYYEYVSTKYCLRTEILKMEEDISNYKNEIKAIKEQIIKHDNERDAFAAARAKLDKKD